MSIQRMLIVLSTNRNNIMTYSYVRWAQCHDWYLGYTESDNGLVVKVRDDERDGVLYFVDIDRLREWAGY
jgi:uncharacterized membrane protein YgcG